MQSCQHNVALTAKEHKRQDAAIYNTKLGLAYLKQGDRARAKRKLLLALKQAPHSPQGNAAMAYFMEKSGELASAKVYYQKAMALSPGRGDQLNNYGAFLCRQGQYHQAEHYFLLAVKDMAYEHPAGAYENAGLCAMAMNEKVKAVTYFVNALERDPGRTQSLYELVKIEQKLGNIDKARGYLRTYSNLVQRDPMMLALAKDVLGQSGNM